MSVNVVRFACIGIYQYKSVSFPALAKPFLEHLYIHEGIAQVGTITGKYLFASTRYAVASSKRHMSVWLTLHTVPSPQIVS